MKTNYISLIIILSSYLSIYGCSTTNLKKIDSQPRHFENHQVIKPVSEKTRPFPEDSLYDLLVADIALRRQQYETALSLYTTQAYKTGDEGVAEMAFGIARHLEKPEESLRLAKLWLNINHESIDAHRAVLQAYALLGNAIDALPYAVWVSKREGDETVFLAVTAIAEGRKDNQIDALINAYKKTSLGSDKKSISELAVAMLLREAGRLKEAESAAKRFLRKSKKDMRGTLLLAQVLAEQNRVSEASKLLAKALTESPENEKLRLQYARLLTESDRREALNQFELLNLTNPASPEIKYLLALLYIDQNMPNLAQPILQQLIQSKHFSDDALFHLGVITENLGDATSALGYYAKVRDGKHFLTAVSRSVLILLDKNGLDDARDYLAKKRKTIPKWVIALYEMEAKLLVSKELKTQAFDLLTAAINRYTNDQTLLYARAMIAEEQGNFKQAEEDLRRIIAQDAENAMAMNALGYTMVLHTERLDEAYDLIHKAYLLRPESPAIVDSMGWVLFKRGEIEEALIFIQRAMDMLPDPEIAAHLGEIHWVMGNRDLAKKAWKDGLLRSPDDDNIISTMQRLGVSNREPE